MSESTEVFETMTKAQVGIYAVRVWRKSDVFQFGDPECLAAVRAIPAREPKSIFEYLKAIPNVAAFEITTESGNGAVHYPEWP